MPGIRRRRVDEADDRPAELLRQLHRPQRLAIAVGPRVAEVAVDLLLGVAALLVADDQHRLALVERGAGDDGVVVGEAAVAVQLDEVGEQALDVVERGRPRRMARHQHALPRRQVLVELAADRRRRGFRGRAISLVAVLAGARSIDSASISFSSTPIGSSNSSRSGIDWDQGQGRACGRSRMNRDRARAAQPLDVGDELFRGAHADRLRDVGADDDVARAAVHLDLDRHRPVAAVLVSTSQSASIVSRGQVAFNRIRTPRDSRSRERRERQDVGALEARRSPRRARTCRAPAAARRSRSGARCCSNISGNTTTSTRALVILEREDAHRIALLGLQAAEAADDAADVDVLDDQAAGRRRRCSAESRSSSDRRPSWRRTRAGRRRGDRSDGRSGRGRAPPSRASAAPSRSTAASPAAG